MYTPKFGVFSGILHNFWILRYEIYIIFKNMPFGRGNLLSSGCDIFNRVIIF